MPKQFAHDMLMLALLLAGSASTLSASHVLPQPQAAHFCRLFVCDGQSIMPLSTHARRVIQPSDSLTSEQLFVEFLLCDNNWQSLRFFPHCQDNGTVTWYAPTDHLPASLDEEHQKYIREVIPRLLAEVEAGNWKTVDDYIDRMLQYQCQFSGSKLPSPPSSYAVMAIFLAFVAISPFVRFFNASSLIRHRLQ